MHKIGIRADQKVSVTRKALVEDELLELEHAQDTKRGLDAQLSGYKFIPGNQLE